MGSGVRIPFSIERKRPDRGRFRLAHNPSSTPGIALIRAPDVCQRRNNQIFTLQRCGVAIKSSPTPLIAKRPVYLRLKATKALAVNDVLGDSLHDALRTSKAMTTPVFLDYGGELAAFGLIFAVYQLRREQWDVVLRIRSKWQRNPFWLFGGTGLGHREPKERG
jgi:hypothetical protein